MEIRYVLMNPTGNRTILVESEVEERDYKKIAEYLLKKEPTAEQVGFLDVKDKKKYRLNMAGGEFCGNATMSAAAYAVMKGWQKTPVKLRVSGTKQELKVDVDSTSDELYTGTVKMPSPVEIKTVSLEIGGSMMKLPAVIFDGITHIILSGIGIAKKKAEEYVRLWSKELGAPALGLMFYDDTKKRLKPLVYVQSPETLYWENSCGSGSVATAAWLSECGVKRYMYEFAEPGGLLRVVKKGKSYYLKGSVLLEKEGLLEMKEAGNNSKKEETKRETEKKETVKKETVKKETVKKETVKKETIKKKAGKKESKKEQQARIQAILAELDRQYGTEYRCYLNYETPWQLLFATIMSAQCTDERVNIVTKDLYVKYKTLEDFANADLKELEQDIHSTGFYHNKAKNIIACAQVLIEKYDGEVPSGIEELTSLPGVGRKTANVIRGNIYHIDSIVVDTHVKRISKKLGITEEDDPEKVEFDLMEKLPRDHWILYNIHIITLGRSICKAPTPKCEECFLKELCPSYPAK